MWGVFVGWGGCWSRGWGGGMMWGGGGWFFVPGSVARGRGFTGEHGLNMDENAHNFQESSVIFVVKLKIHSELTAEKTTSWP